MTIMDITWNVVMTHCQDECTSLSGGVPKNLTLRRMNKICFQKYHEKAEIHSFPTMYIKGGVNIWSKSVKTRIFSKKVPSKQHFSWTRIRINWLRGGLGPPILKLPTFFTCSLKTLGHKLSDELLGSPLASILSDRRPLEIFLQSITTNCQKRTFFAFQQITWDFDIETHIQGSTMWKLTSWGFRKCIR